MEEKANEVVELENRLKQSIDYVRDCDARVTKGEIMELQGLDNNVIELCEGIAKLPQEEAKVLQDKMDILIKALEGLAKTIKEHQTESGEV